MDTILIVEDDEEIREVFEEMLSKKKLLLADSDWQARRLFDTHKSEIALVFMDGFLSPYDAKIDSIALTRWMRSEGFANPIVAMSGDDEMQKRQIAAGCTHRVYKFERKKIVALVENALKK